MCTIRRYADYDSRLWDDFVKDSRNGTFLFNRAYMDYHRDRFIDHSMLYNDEKGRLLAIMPCNECGKTLQSHQGLTYGGLILSPKVHAVEIQQIFDSTVDYLRKQGFEEWIYKVIPTIYHRIPSQEEEYFLWRHGAELIECNLSSTIFYGDTSLLKAEYCRRNAVTRLSKQGLMVNMAAELDSFWPLLEKRLDEKYSAKPVHTLEEMHRLQRAFPENIKCCTAVDNGGATLAGVVLYETGQTIHVQYSASTEQGQLIGAHDFLYMSLVGFYKNKQGVRFFDFGTSNENGGRILNATLNRYKEGFGARGVAYKKFRIKL